MPHPPSDLVRDFERRAPEVRVLVVGDAMLDVYLDGSASRISPEAPVPVVRVEGERRALGGAANVAANVKALGAACALVACVGRDAEGDALLEELARAGVEAGGVERSSDRPTSVKTRVLVRGQQVARYDRETHDELTPAAAGAVIDALERTAGPVHAVAIEDYDKGVMTGAVVAAALSFARARSIPVVVDPKARGFFAYAGATVFKPNRSELEAALREPVRASDAGWLAGVLRRLECDALVITLGEDGMVFVEAGGDVQEIPTVARSVFDVSGAGDTVTAVLATALGAGFGVREAATLANQAAGVQVGKSGVATVSAREIARAADRGARAASTAPGEEFPEDNI
ncbi:MAG: PfkB family carbohydrate kinase [Gemmatimonadota bacterium]